jgi:hypothetical protein
MLLDLRHRIMRFRIPRASEYDGYRSSIRKLIYNFGQKGQKATFIVSMF